MYTAKITSKNLIIGKNRLAIGVEYTDGTTTHNLSYDFPLYTTLEQIKKRIKEQIEEFDAGEILEPTVPVGDVDLTGITTGTTQEQKDVFQFFQKKAKLDRLNEVKTLGFLTGAKATALDTAIANLKAEMNTEFKAVFVNHF